MAISMVSNSLNVVPFPGPTRERPSVEAMAQLAPGRSFVDTLIAERGDVPRDVQAAFAREFAYQAHALEAGYGPEGTIVRLRALVNAHIDQAWEVCRAYQDAQECLMYLEVRVARMERVAPTMQSMLNRARAEWRGRAIAARASADGALGAASALATYIQIRLDTAPASDAEPRQLTLFAASAG